MKKIKIISLIAELRGYLVGRIGLGMNTFTWCKPLFGRGVMGVGEAWIRSREE